MLKRREFLVGCSAAIAALAGSRFNYAAFGDPQNEPNQEILAVVFLRGGCDGLNIVPPVAGDDRGSYENARPRLQIPASGDGAALHLDSRFGLHPAAASLHELYQDGKLAIVHAVGMNTDTRSHFDAMEFMELGTPGSKSVSTGWLTRHLRSAANLPDEIVMPALAAGNLQPTSLQGSYETVAMSNPDSFSLNTGPWLWRDAQRLALRQLYGGRTWLHQAGTQTLNAVDIVETNASGDYEPANGATYPDGSFGNNLQVIAQMIKLQLGLRVATVDLGGWDTHEGQGNGSEGYFADLLRQLAEGLAALYTDLDGAGPTNDTQRLTVVVLSEFGRRLRENADSGTDHGHGNVMLVLGGNVNGGQILGEWPGLHSDQLYDRADLAVTTDYRRVLSEILIRRLGNPQLGIVFPDYTDYEPLGVVQGTDLTPIYEAPLDHRVYLPLVSR